MKLYRALLHLYPVAFRAEYEQEMCAVFARRRREASTLLGALALWADTVFDVLVTAAQVHWDILRQDVRYALRTLRGSPGFAAAAILVVALGVGANTAVFSVTDHVLIRPLPFADSQRLVKLWEDESFRGYSQTEPSPANYRDWKRMSASFEAMAAYRGLSVNLVGEGDPERLDGAAMTFDLLPMLGAQPHIGRIFTAEDDKPEAPGTLLLSHSLWKQRFDGDSSVLGRKVVLDGAPYTIIGVMPPDFHFPARYAMLWTAMRFTESDFEDRTNTYLHVVAKLRRSASLDQARAEMRVVAAQLERAYQKENAHIGARVNRLRDEISARSRLLLTALLAASVCVLLIACTNLANLLVARAMMRRKELAVRTALGAGRERLIRQLLTESMILAACGGFFGVLMAFAGVPSLTRLVPTTLPIAEAPTIDLRVLAFALLITGLTGIGFGVAPAMRACAAGVAAVREGSRQGVGGRRERFRAALVVAEVAASVVLLISSGLLVRAILRLYAVDPGFRPDSVLTLRTSLSMPKYEATAARDRFYSTVLPEVRGLPGVVSAGYVSFLPLVVRGGVHPVRIEGRLDDAAERHYALLRFVTPGYLTAMGIPLLRGRDVSESDTRGSPSIAVVSDSFVREHWPGEDPIGRRFRFAEAVRTVAGVVGDTRIRGLEVRSEPQVYLPYKQVPDGWYTWFAPKDLAIRASGNPSKLLPAIRRIVAKADPQQPISDVQMLSEIVEAETAPRRVQLRVLGAFTAVAFLLAGIGIHGLLSFTVSQRAQEIGVRIAMGAKPRDILRMVLGEGVLLAAIGIALGGALAYAAGRSMEALLAGVKPGDAATFSAGILVALIMTVAGSFVPALRALRVDPMSVIRAE